MLRRALQYNFDEELCFKTFQQQTILSSTRIFHLIEFQNSLLEWRVF